MKKSVIVGLVVGLHVLVVGSLFLIQGCGTTPTPPPESTPPIVMPPPLPPAPPVVPPPPQPPAVKPPKAVELKSLSPETKTYTVKSGDSVSIIAQRFNVSTRDVLRMNKISDANKIRVGQKIVLPGYVNLNAPEPVRKPRKVEPPAAGAPAAGPAVASGQEYVVKSGDSLSVIAKNNGVTTKALREVNGLTADKIVVGQKLKLPKAGAGGESVAAAPGGEPVAPVVEAVPALPPVAPGEILHVVEAGQDLNSIAMMYGVQAEEIVRMNNLTNLDVSVGQALKMPPPSDM